jgi:pseudaminic acid cytidylyltransferase
MTICVIPARSGSKRIKNKNIINFFGKPIISYSIRAAIYSGIFSKVIVSTDSKKIQKIAIKYGAECSFLRSKKLSNDKVSVKEVLIDTIKKVKSNETEYHCLLLATAPLIKAQDLIKAHKAIRLNKKTNALICVSEMENSPLRSFFVKKKYLKFKWEENQKKNSQELQKLFYDTGSFYFFKTKELLREKKFFLDRSIPFYLGKEKSIDLNTAEDLKILKYFYKQKTK